MKVFTGNRLLILLVAIVAVLFLLSLRAGDAVSLLDLVPHNLKVALSRRLFTIGETKVTLILCIKAVLFVFGITFASRLSRRLVQRWVRESTAIDEGQRYAFEVVTGYAVFIFGLLMGLQAAKIDLSSLAILGGAVGVGIGFGLQTIVSNFVSGLILLVERPIKVGDRIEVAGTKGEVMRIGPRATLIKSGNGAVVVIPNSQFVTEPVLNATAPEPRAKVVVRVGASYGSDPEQVRNLLLGVARGHPDVLQTPAPEVVMARLGDSALEFELGVWTLRQASTTGRLASDLYFEIFSVFKSSGIDIPAPQREVHIRTQPGEVAR